MEDQFSDVDFVKHYEVISKIIKFSRVCEEKMYNFFKIQFGGEIEIS